MKFALITYEYPPVGGGTGKVAQAMARALIARGHSVTIVTSQFGDLAAEEKDGALGIIRIPVLRKRINLARSWEVLSFALSGRLHLKKIKEAIDPDYCLGFFTIPCSMVARAYEKKYGTPFLTFLLGQDVPGFKDTPPLLFTLTKPIIKSLWRRSKLVIANSASLAEMAKNTLPNLDFKVIANAVNPGIYAPGSTPRPPAPFVVLYIGRLRDFKGIPDLIDAFAIFKEKSLCPVLLRIAGFGPSRDALVKQVRESGLDNEVVFLGRLEEKEVVQHLRQAHVFVNPSYDEGMPSSVLEAMGCGTPAVASDIKPHAEIITNGEDGLLFPARNWEALSECLVRLQLDPGLRRSLAEAGRRRILERFTWERRAGELLQLIENLKPAP